MNLEPLLGAPVIVQAHAYAAVIAIVLGAVQLTGPKGTAAHITIGVVWIAAMAVIAGTSVFIGRPIEPGDPFWARFSWIHLFTVLTIFGLSVGLGLLASKGARRRGHGRAFSRLYLTGLLIAGLFAFLPGRIMHQVVFGG